MRVVSVSWPTAEISGMVLAAAARIKAGFKNARHTAYDFFGSHAYQKYFTSSEIDALIAAVGIHPKNVLRISKGLYRLRKGAFASNLDDTLITFGKA